MYVCVSMWVVPVIPFLGSSILPAMIEARLDKYACLYV